jgi:hypothetical protein
MTFGARQCEFLTDFDCIGSVFENFYQNQMLANCSAECPTECAFVEYATMQTFSDFPPASYLYYILSQSETLSQKYFNQSALEFLATMVTMQDNLVPPIDVLQSTLSGKLLSLNIFYNDLVYTKIEESAKMSLIDLIAGIGGTLVNRNYLKISSGHIFLCFLFTYSKRACLSGK